MGDSAASGVVAVAPREVAAAFWDALYARDWPRVRSFFGPESIYYDVPTTPAAAARGPESIEARLRLALAGLSEYSHGDSRVVAEGDLVVTEHEEHWGWPTGEKVTLPFVSIQRVVDGVIVLWRDYWDLNTLMAAAPPGWQESMAAGDLSWVFDATGLV
ncbi:nuclear transport factor 2 family protein [Pseudofrankia asymbiotica]|uniref:nuclear transport factor 2 family protein n=1 Tax=Pseudofrankia asymbiotica TaxID=1834516 RepID=UPI0009D6F7DB|nr:nuclear transport factor 2 family protein [Pseudofrankia asymbiotica]